MKLNPFIFSGLSFSISRGVGRYGIDSISRVLKESCATRSIGPAHWTGVEVGKEGTVAIPRFAFSILFHSVCFFEIPFFSRQIFCLDECWLFFFWYCLRRVYLSWARRRNFYCLVGLFLDRFKVFVFSLCWKGG